MPAPQVENLRYSCRLHRRLPTCGYSCRIHRRLKPAATIAVAGRIPTCGSSSPAPRATSAAACSTSCSAAVTRSSAWCGVPRGSPAERAPRQRSFKAMLPTRLTWPAPARVSRWPTGSSTRWRAASTSSGPTGSRRSGLRPPPPRRACEGSSTWVVSGPMTTGSRRTFAVAKRWGRSCGRVAST